MPFKPKWLDYGCGSGGGLIDFAISSGINAYGYEEDYANKICTDRNLPIIKADQINEYEACFYFITLIEVIEHIENPIQFLVQVRKLLKPGGVLFITTGNVAPWKNSVASWSYASIPDVHICFFDPFTLAYALKESGFAPQKNLSFSGFENIIKFKVLKNLIDKKINFLQRFVSWAVIVRMVDLKYKITAMQIGIAK